MPHARSFRWESSSRTCRPRRSAERRPTGAEAGGKRQAPAGATRHAGREHEKRRRSLEADPRRSSRRWLQKRATHPFRRREPPRLRRRAARTRLLRERPGRKRSAERNAETSNGSKGLGDFPCPSSRASPRISARRAGSTREPRPSGGRTKSPELGSACSLNRRPRPPNSVIGRPCRYGLGKREAVRTSPAEPPDRVGFRRRAPSSNRASP